MTREPAKFLFDQDFAAAAEVRPAVPLALHNAQLQEAAASGYGRGFAAAKAEAQQLAAATPERIATTLEDVKRGPTAAASDEAVSRYVKARLAAASTQDVPWRSDR